MAKSRIVVIALFAALASAQCSYGGPTSPSQVPLRTASPTAPRWFLTVQARWTLSPQRETTSAPTATFPVAALASPSRSPTQALTPSPLPPLTHHQWSPQPVLVYFDATGGDGCCPHPFPPGLVVYADGTVFTMGWDQEWFLETAHLQRPEICQLLNTIDQLGFFEYDETSYSIDMSNPPVDGSATWQVSVNAWKSKSVSLYAIGSIIRMLDEPALVECDYCPPLPTILPAIRNTYNLLSSYAPPLRRFESPDLLALWVERPELAFDPSPEEPRPWPLTSPKLRDLQAKTEAIGEWDKPGAFLTGPDARTVFSSFDYTVVDFGLPFTEDSQTFQVFALPVLPGEMGSPYPEIPSSLTCSPSDGILPLPETP